MWSVTPRLNEVTGWEHIDGNMLIGHEAPREVSGGVDPQYSSITENELPSEEMSPRKKNSRTSNSFVVHNPVR